MPVTTASVERTFSALRRLTTYIRSTMYDDRSTGCALMHVHQDVPIDVDSIIARFEAKGSRKISTLFDTK
jgi:hypothetical protein